MNLALSNTYSNFENVWISFERATSSIFKVIGAIGDQVSVSPIGRIANKVLEGSLPTSSEVKSAGKFLSMIHSMAITEFTTMMHRRDKDVSNFLLTRLALQNAPNKEAYLQVLAQQAVYNKHHDGHLFTTSNLFASPQYELKKTISYPEGIKMMFLAPDNPKEVPLILVQGTDFSNIHNVIDDLHENAGTLNLMRYKKEIVTEIELLEKNHGRIHILGHSYGGAIAQQLTSEYPSLICRCSSYNSLGVGKAIVEKFKSNVALLPPGCSKPEIVSYRHAKDLPSLVGKSHLPTDPNRRYTAGTVDDKISHTEAHALNTLSTEMPHVTDDHPPALYTEVASFMETCRTELSNIIPFYTEITRK